MQVEQRKRIVYGATTLLAFLVLWETASRSGLYNAQLMPPPTAVASAAWEMARSGELLQDVLYSLQRVAVGYVAGCLVGVFIGTLTGSSRTFEYSVGYLVQLARPIPGVAFVPLAILWFGLGESSKYFLVFWGVLFPVWVNTHLGIQRVDKHLVWAAESLGASRRQVFLRVILPASATQIVAGMRTSRAIAFICLVAAEMAGAFAGLGYRIEASHLVFRADKMLTGLLVLGALGAISDAAFNWLLSKVAPWHFRHD